MLVIPGGGKNSVQNDVTNKEMIRLFELILKQWKFIILDRKVTRIAGKTALSIRARLAESRVPWSMNVKVLVAGGFIYMIFVGNADGTDASTDSELQRLAQSFQVTGG